MKSLRVNRVENGTAGAARDIACDAVLMCGGWTPCLHLFSHTKGSLAWDETLQAFLPGKKSEAVHIAGAGRGLWGIAAALTDGAAAGAQAARDAGREADARRPTPSTADRTGSGVTLKELPTDRNPATAKAFIDFQNDVTAKDIRLAVREGMRSIEHVKRYTTNGMATDQGKMSNVNGLMIAADALGKAPPQVGLTTFRPPYTPTTFGTFAGYHQDATFEVTRQDPDRPLGRGPRRGLRAGRPLAPRLVLPASRARTCTPPSPASAAPPAPRSASSTPRPSARSRSSAPTPSPSWSGCTPTPGRSSGSAAAATACCSARTASSATTASSAASPPTASTSPPPPAARRASST